MGPPVVRRGAPTKAVHLINPPVAWQLPVEPPVAWRLTSTVQTLIVTLLRAVTARAVTARAVTVRAVTVRAITVARIARWTALTARWAARWATLTARRIVLPRSMRPLTVAERRL